jgi:hypothetical protein
VGIQESRLASNDFKKAAERVRERWALGESKPVNAFFRGAAVAILQHFKEYHRTHAYTHTQSRTLLDTAPGVGTGACGGSPAGEADCEFRNGYMRVRVRGWGTGGSPAPRSGRSAQAGTAYRSASSGLGEHWVAAIAHTLVEHTHLIPRHHAHDAAATAHPAQRWR